MDLTKIFPQFKGTKKLETYNSEVENLGEKQKLVYTSLKGNFANGATAKELSVFLYNNRKVMSPERNSVHPRLNELIQMGLVEVIGKKTCQYTDKRVSIYKSK